MFIVFHIHTHKGHKHWLIYALLTAHTQYVLTSNKLHLNPNDGTLLSPILGKQSRLSSIIQCHTIQFFDGLRLVRSLSLGVHVLLGGDKQN